MAISPTVRRRRLGIELRKLRNGAGLKLEDVAVHLGVQVSTLSRIETGKAPCRAAYVTTMFDLYGVADDAHRQVLKEMAREGQQRGWWAMYDDVLPTGFGIYVGLETEASSLRAYDTHLVHGLLQTEDYAREVFRAAHPHASDEDIAKLIDVRVRRRQIFERESVFDLWVVLDEAALRRRIGGQKVMYAQLDRLCEFARASHVTLQVLPLSNGAHAGIDGGFQILEFPEVDDMDIVYIECQAGNVFLEKHHEIRRYETMFNRLRADALSPDDSAVFLAEVKNDYS